MPVDDILERSDLYEKPGKYQHACCIDMDREGDTRIIQNLKDTERWMETTLHELGHAVYNKYIDSNLPYILRDTAHTFTTEAIALLFGRNTKIPLFLKNYCDIKEDLFKEIKENSFDMFKMRQLIFARWSFVMFNFERELYKNPDQNLNKLWWNLTKKYQLIDFSRNSPDWASKIHFISSPVYYHNYLLGEVLASQIHIYIIKNILKNQELNNYDYSNNKEVGGYLKKHVFLPGAKYEWHEMVKKATGKLLTPKYFIEQFIKN